VTEEVGESCAPCRSADKRARLALWAGVGAVCVTCLVGGALALGGPDYTSARKALLLAEKELLYLEALLLAHRRSHGRFPTTAEGWRTLNGYVRRFPTDGEHGEKRRVLFAYSRALRKAAQDHGGYPDNQDALWRALGISRCPPCEEDGLEVAISPKGGLHLLQYGQPLSPWDVPYCYVNLQEVEQDGLEDLAPESPLGMYSRTVSGRVRIFAVGGKMAWERKVRLPWFARMATMGLVVVFVILWLLWHIRVWVAGHKRDICSWILPILLVVASPAAGGLLRVMLTGSSRGIPESYLGRFERDAQKLYVEWLEECQRKGLMDARAAQERARSFTTGSRKQ